MIKSTTKDQFDETMLDNYLRKKTERYNASSVRHMVCAKIQVRSFVHIVNGIVSRSTFLAKC